MKMEITRLPSTFAVPPAYEHGRFQLVGDITNPQWARKYPRVPSTPWCRLTIHTDGFVSSYGGEVWPSAWPELFERVDRGTHGSWLVLSPLGRELFGLPPEVR